MPHQVRQLIADGKAEQALKRLSKLTSQDKHLSREVLSLQARFNRLSREQRMGVLSDQNANLERNRIEHAVLSLADELPTCTTGAGGGSTTRPPLVFPLPPSGNPNIPWAVGIGALLLILGLLLFVPCPTVSQFFAFRIILALATAVLASQLPGMFHFEWPPTLKAGGALAIFALLYLVNPAQLVGEGKCSPEPFEFTVQLKPRPGLDLPDTYPKLEDARVGLWLDNYWKYNDAINDGVADFKTLPANKRDQTVPAQLNARYWRLATDSIALNGKSQTAFIEPDCSLAAIKKENGSDSSRYNPTRDKYCRVSGIIRCNECELDRIEQVTLSVDGKLFTTRPDCGGNFSIENLPAQFKDDQYVLQLMSGGKVLHSEYIKLCRTDITVNF